MMHINTATFNHAWAVPKFEVGNPKSFSAKPVQAKPVQHVHTCMQPKEEKEQTRSQVRAQRRARLRLPCHGP